MNFEKCPYMPHHGGCHYPDCPATCNGRVAICERRSDKAGEWTCDHCKALWFGELAKTDWRPSECSGAVGPCEVCGRQAACSDVPSSSLPMPKPKRSPQESETP